MCSRFNTEDGKESNIFGALCFISRKVNATEMQTKFVQHMEKVLWPSECGKSGLQSLVLETRLWMCSMSGRSVEVDGDQIETLMEKNQRNTMQEIADILKISKSSVESRLHQLGYVNDYDIWVPCK